MTYSYSVILRRGGFVALFATLSLGVAVRADESIATEVRALFEAGWKPSIKGLESAVGHATQAKQLAPADVRVPFALALVYMKNSKLEAAATELDAALANAKSPLLPIRRSRIYIAALTKDFPNADREMRSLANRLSGEDLPGDGEQAYRESAKFLGSVLEYLAAQEGTAVKADAVAALDKHILSNLKGGRAGEYAAGRAEAAKLRFDKEAELVTVKAATLEDNTQKRTEALAKIDAPVMDAQTQAANAVAQEKTFKETSESDRARHEPMARQALAQLQTLSGQLGTLQARVRSLNSEIDKIKKENEKGKKEKPPKKEKDFKREEQELKQTENKVRELQGEISRLEANPSVAFMRNYNAQLQRLATAIAATNQNLAAVKKKADNSRSNLLRIKVTDAGPKTTTLENEIKALSTYTQLALDAERERILGSYRPK